MREYIKKIQSKPEDVRKSYVFGAMVVSMIFVGSIWVYSVHDILSSDTEEVATEEVSPFALFRDSFNATYDNISASVGSVSFSRMIQEEVVVPSETEMLSPDVPPSLNIELPE